MRHHNNHPYWIRISVFDKNKEFLSIVHHNCSVKSNNRIKLSMHLQIKPFPSFPPQFKPLNIKSLHNWIPEKLGQLF